jgi:hypothetical protein
LNVKNKLTLVGLEIEGDWNIPLLTNAAQMSGASLLFARNADSTGKSNGESVSSWGIDELLGQFDHVLACEATARSQSVYDFAVPRGHLGIVVGNERNGIPSSVLKKAEQVVSIPMLGRGLSSVNVAVAAAIILYALEGRENPFAFNSCSHGAGRAMSRGDAFRTISDKNFATSMEGVVHQHDTRIKDEAPAAYKDIRRVMRSQKDLVKILYELQPLLSVKGR